MVYSAKVVIGDMDLKKAEEVVLEIKSLGRLVPPPSLSLMIPVSSPIPSDAVAHKCDVRSWDQQLDLFQTAMKIYGRIDIVVPNAGVTESGSFAAARETAINGVPVKPDILTLEINLIGVLYSAFDIPWQVSSLTRFISHKIGVVLFARKPPERP